jgi:hypothetical protein
MRLRIYLFCPSPRKYESNSVFGFEKVDRWNAIQSKSRPMRFLGFSNREKGAPKPEIWKWWTVCSTFSRSGWSVVRSASLAKGGASKKRPSPHLHKFPTRSNKVSPRTLQKPVVFCFVLLIGRLPTSARAYTPSCYNSTNLGVFVHSRKAVALSGGGGGYVAASVSLSRLLNALSNYFEVMCWRLTEI